MAGETADDNSRIDWCLLLAEWRLTFERAQSEELADLLVRRYLEEGERDREGRLRYRIYEVHSVPGGVPSPYSGEFWCSDPNRDIYCIIDCQNSCARWTGPADESRRQMFGQRIAECDVRMIRFNHRLYLEFLQSAGLPGPATKGTLATVEAPDGAAFTGAPVASGTLDPAAVSMPANVTEPIEPKVWYAKARKANPRRADEGLGEYDRRIYRLMVEAVAARAVTKQWSVETIARERRGRQR